MAIRFKYQAAAGMIGAYAQGVGKANNRREKNALDMWQQERQRSANIYRSAMGMGKANKRKQKNALDMWQQERQRSANIYRSAMGGSRARQSGQSSGQQIQGTTDPFEQAVASGDTQKAVQIKAQRQANARAQRMGKPVPYPQAEMQPIFALTKEEIEQKKFERDAEYEQGIYDRNQKDKAIGIAKQQALDIKKSTFTDLQKRFNEIDPGDPNAWADADRRKRYYEIKKALETGQRDQEGAKQLEPIEFYNEGIAKMGEFLRGHEPNHIIPWNKRKGNTDTTEDGRMYLITPEGGREFQGFADEGQMTREKIDAGLSQNYRPSPFGGYEKRIMGEHGIEWKPVTMPKETSYGETYNKWAANWIKTRDNYLKEHGENASNPTDLKGAEEYANRLYPKPPEGGGNPASPSASQPTQGGNGPQPEPHQRQTVPLKPTLGPMPPGAAAAVKQPQDAEVVAGMEQQQGDLLSGAFPGIPQAKTPADVAKLKPGDMFIAPDGMPKMVPTEQEQLAGINARREKEAEGMTLPTEADFEAGRRELERQKQFPNTPARPIQTAPGGDMTLPDAEERVEDAPLAPEGMAKNKRKALFEKYKETRAKQRQARKKSAARKAKEEADDEIKRKKRIEKFAHRRRRR